MIEGLLMAAARRRSPLASLRALVIALSNNAGMYEVRPGYCWQDTAGTTPANVGDPIARIDDLSGQGNPLLQSISGRYPTMSQSGSLYYAAFDGADDFLQTGSQITNLLGEDLSIYAATAYASGGSSATAPGFIVRNNSTNYFFAGQRQNNGTAYASSRHSSTGVGTATAAKAGETSAGTPYVTRAELSAAGTKVQVNNTTEATAASVGTVGPTDAYIGISNASGGSFPYGFDFYGGVVNRSILSAPNALIVKQYLGLLCGVSL